MATADEEPNKSQLDYYDGQTSDYEKEGLLTRQLGRAYARKASIIFEKLERLNAKRVLEVGVGSGLVTHYLSQLHQDEYYALDLSSAMLELAQERTREDVQFVQGDATAPEFEPSYFDAIVGVDIIHHIDDPVTAFGNWRSLVRQGDQMIFLETNIYNPLNLRNIGVEHEVRSFLNTDKNLTKWSEKAGWEDVSVTPAPSFTPSGPAPLEPIFNWVDQISVHIPIWNKLAALWLIVNTKSSDSSD